VLDSGRRSCIPVGQDQAMPAVTISQDPAAEDLLGRDPLALLLGMMLDQQLRQRSSDARRCGCSCRS
jgi:hypothetical protein